MCAAGLVLRGAPFPVQVLFVFELTVASLVRASYFASLYFWIDLAATFSMLLDITALMDIIFHQDSMAGTNPLDRGNQSKVQHGP